jgi:hypothetical protein
MVAQPARAVLEPHEHRRQVLARDAERFALVSVSVGKRLGSPPPAETACDDRVQIGEHLDDRRAGDVLREIAPVRADIGERGARAPLSGSSRHEKSVGFSSQSCR